MTEQLAKTEEIFEISENFDGLNGILEIKASRIPLLTPGVENPGYYYQTEYQATLIMSINDVKFSNREERLMKIEFPQAGSLKSLGRLLTKNGKFNFFVTEIVTEALHWIKKRQDSLNRIKDREIDIIREKQEETIGNLIVSLGISLTKSKELKKFNNDNTFFPVGDV